jgi:glycosyltransferase involved in cell wall biosynthesis
MTFWLSVIMPVHGGAALLGATLASAADEQPDGVEFRLYNSAADDGAARAVALQFANKLNIVWQDTPEHKAWTAKTNLGVAEARARHVVMLHQDDVWLPGHLLAVREAIAVADNAVMSVGPSRFIGSAGQDLGGWNLPFAPGRYDGREFAQTLLVQSSIAIPSPVISREAWLESGGLDDELWFSADWDFYLKLAALGDVFVRPRATTAFRLHGGSLTMTGSRDIRDYREQLEIVLARHSATLAPLEPATLRRAKVSIAFNYALAAAWHGKIGALPGALLRLAALGPWGVSRWLTETRIVDRVRPRIALALAGAL